jgi:hypothetical protein
MRIIFMHKLFIIIDLTLTLICFILSWVFISRPCHLSFLLYYCIFFLVQTLQHIISLQLPKIDSVKHDPLIRRYLLAISLV